VLHDWQVGLDLLQLAVHTGSVKLANRILSGLLAPPLNLPFTPLALGQVWNYMHACTCAFTHAHGHARMLSIACCTCTTNKAL